MYKKNMMFARLLEHVNNYRYFGVLLSVFFYLFAGEMNLVMAVNAEMASHLDQTQQETIRVTGVVKSTDGELLTGVAVTLQSNKRIGQTTDINGQYIFPNLRPNDKLLFSYLGMEPVEITIQAGKTVYDVTMSYSAQQIQEVVVETGIIQRNKLGFTGSYSTVTRDELKAVGGINLVQALKSLDPSFIVTDNLMSGSNPNVLANIQVRGQTSMSVTSMQEESNASINQPLFIKDGFEISLAEFNDLDINRIESITILKDAGSTAIYGSKGANGVIVIETVKPKQGEIFVSYNSDVQFSFPDLSGYNLMNAAEKLEFEKKAQRWGNISETTSITGQTEYYRRLALVQSGIDTYWLAEPVRNSITHNHSLTVSSGGKDVLFDVGVNYKDYEGVMKDSRRETYGGNVKLIYRGVKGLNISNNMIVSGVNSHDGPWGSFSEFAQAIPYFRKRNSDGTIPRVIDRYTSPTTTTIPSKTYYAYNPLYNATLNSRTDDRYFYFTNNTAIDWFVHERFRVAGGLSLKKTSQDFQYFKDPRHSDYAETVYTKKGDYTGTKMNSWHYSVNLSASYALLLAEKHNITSILRGAMQETQTRKETYSVEGFPEGSIGVPSHAYGYVEGSPKYSDVTKREMSFLWALNYNYLYRYLFDFNYNIDGSTTFGSNKRFRDFWSVGLGWNLHKEAFAENWGWLTELKVSGTIGTNANQNQNLVTTSVYNYHSGNTQFGQGAYLSQFANPDLKWQVTEKKALSMESVFWGNRMKITLGIYAHHTNPLVASLEQKPSSGTGVYPFNMGYMDSEGMDFTFLIFPIYDRKKNIFFSFRVQGAHGKSTYGGYGRALDVLNKEYLSASTREDPTSIQMFEDGRSPSDIWAVRSLGIDPATGREVFLTKKGEQVFSYNSDDRVVVGNTKPDWEGTINLNLIWKKLQINTTFRYRFGGDRLNTALYNKVENIPEYALIYNQDKRALYDRWQKDGDIKPFVSISEVKKGHPLSSRFVQKEDEFILEAAKITWDFSKDKWIRSWGMKDLKLSISMNDIFKFSTIKMEKGIDYPFERSFLVNLTTRF